MGRAQPSIDDMSPIAVPVQHFGKGQTAHPHQLGSKTLEVYVYRGVKGEEVPETAEKLIVKEGVQGLPNHLCYYCESLREVCLLNGLKAIGNEAFSYCENLLEITICSTVQSIGDLAFAYCVRLVKVEFEHYYHSTSSSITTTQHITHHHHQPTRIGEYAFHFCTNLQRIEIPSFVVELDPNSFEDCAALVEANLSKSSITKVSEDAFSTCMSLQTVSLPKTLEQIDHGAFYECSELVTVILPLDSKRIKIGQISFDSCVKLANFWLPKDSTAERDSFEGCTLLIDRHGDDSSSIVAGLAGRFENFAIHRMCYDHSTTTPDDLKKYMENQVDDESFSSSLVDEFGMTPFHILSCTIGPSLDLLQILLELLPNQILLYTDANGKRPLDYLINNWTESTSSLVQTMLQTSMVDPLVRWGTTSWMRRMERLVQAIYDAKEEHDDDKEQRTALLHKAYSALEHYENVEATSTLELALWKRRIDESSSNEEENNGGKRRNDCRVLSGSNVVIPHVAAFFAPSTI